MSGEAASYAQVLRLFEEGHRVENIVSGWHLSENRIAELVIAGHRAGATINPEWLAPPGLRDAIFEVLETRPDLGPVEISSAFKGKISPHMIRALRVVRGDGRGIETTLLTEDTFKNKLHDDLHGARREIIVVAPEVKSRHWRFHFEAFRRLMVSEGQVAFFAGRVSELVEEEIRESDIILIEKRTHANLVLIDGKILWEGSMNFLLPPAGEEHVRRTVSRLQCDEIRELHDLFL